MHLERLELTDYRNYAEAELTLGRGRFVLSGDNAQGKSNLCEAIRLLATMRSFRAGTDRELVRWGAIGHFARLVGTVERTSGPLTLEFVISAPPTAEETAASMPEDAILAPPLPPGLGTSARKRIKVNGTPRRAIDCVGLVTVVLFEPTDLDLVAGGPQGRRHFMDVTLCQISRSYCRALSQYQRILTQRSALLRRIRENQDDPRALSYWDTQLAEQAVPIIMERAGLVTRCNPTADQIALRLGGKGLRLAYQPSFPIAPETSAAEAVNAFQEKLKEIRRREMHQGVNLLGPHRDDLGFIEGTVDLGTFGSRGQQRAAALALKLAELEAIETETGDQPILVLDDVLSELDPKRRAALLESVSDIEQVIITTAEPDSLPISFTSGARVLSVKSGHIEGGTE